MSLTSIQSLALAVAKLDDDASRWTESDAMEVSEVTDEHLRAVLDRASALRTAAAVVVVRAGDLMVARTRAKTVNASPSPIRNIEAAKAAVNHAQVVCACAMGLPLDANVDEGDGSAVFRALADAYSALCAEEQPTSRDPLNLDPFIDGAQG